MFTFVRFATAAAAVAMLAGSAVHGAGNKEVQYWADSQTASRAGLNDHGASADYAARAGNNDRGANADYAARAGNNDRGANADYASRAGVNDRAA